MNRLRRSDLAGLHARVATEAEIAIADRLREDAEQRPSVKRAGQWQYEGERARRNRELRRDRIADGTLHLVFTGRGVPVGMFCLDEQLNPELWADADIASACVIHETVVGSWASRLYVGSSIHDLASRMAAERGKQWLRLDAWKTNERLQRIYFEDGFEPVALVDLPHRFSGALFQRPAGVVTNLGVPIKHRNVLTSDSGKTLPTLR